MAIWHCTQRHTKRHERCACSLGWIVNAVITVRSSNHHRRVVEQTVQGNINENIPHYWPFSVQAISDQRISLTMDQECGKHLQGKMSSSIGNESKQEKLLCSYLGIYIYTVFYTKTHKSANQIHIWGIYLTFGAALFVIANAADHKTWSKWHDHGLLGISY